jgi:hypothetical protein
MAAFTSRSCSTPHSGHLHLLADRGSSSLTKPQAEQRFELGNHLPTRTKVRPYQDDLYSSCRTNSASAPSAKARDKWRLRIIPDTFRSSTQITWFS